MEYFKILNENSDRMLDLISDLLTISRIESEKIIADKKSFSAKDMAEKLIAEFGPALKASNIEVGLHTPENLPDIFSDPEKIKLVMENLLDNAVKYSKPRGKIAITLSAKDNRFLFEIRDDGIGIPKDDQKYVFQKFFRSKNITSHETQGSGLGLNIAKSVLEICRGKIGFKSEENKGSTFWFSIPVK